jgi:hypothetical protein
MVRANHPAAPGMPLPRLLPWLILAAAALVALVLFGKLPPWPKYWVVLGNAAHAPVFGILAVICLLVLSALTRSRSTWLVPLAFLITVGGGIAVEWLQTFVGRDSSWDDVVTDALGATCALAFVLWRQSLSAPSSGRLTRSLAPVLMLACAAAILYPLAEAGAAYSRRASLFPVIAQFDSPLDLYFVSGIGAVATRGPLPDNWRAATDPESLRVLVASEPYPGVAFTEPARNWGAWSTLKLDITNPDARPLDLNARVHDMAHTQHYDDRFNRRFLIDGSTRTTISIPLQDIQQGPKSRLLDLESIAGVIVFTDGPSAAFGRQFYLTRIWLE